MRPTATLLTIGLALFAPVIWGQTSDLATRNVVEREVLETQSRRFQAMVDVDLQTLETILSSELTYTHTSGRMETKREFLSSLQNRSIIYESIKPAEIIIRVYGSTAVVTGISELIIVYRQRPMMFSIRFIEVYYKNDGAWQLIAWQSADLS